MERRALRLVEALASAGHFGRAAERMGMAQPHLSTALKMLEAELGVQLFERRPMVRLTPAGEIVLRAAQRASADMGQALEAARQVHAGASGAVSVGFASSVMLTGVAPVIRAFQRDRPDVRLTLHDMHSNPQWEAMASGRLDVALTREIKAASDVACTLIHQEPLTVALPGDHRLAVDGGSVSLQQLASEAFVLFPEHVAPRLHSEIVGACIAAGFAPEVVQAADEWQTILAFVALGAGVTIGPRCLSSLPFENVAFRDLTGTRATVRIFLCHRRSGLSAAAAAFVAFVSERAEVTFRES